MSAHLSEQIINRLREMDLTMPILCAEFKMQAEDVWRYLKPRMVYGKISRNERLVIYGAVDDVWFHVQKAKKEKEWALTLTNYSTTEERHATRLPNFSVPRRRVTFTKMDTVTAAGSGWRPGWFL